MKKIANILILLVSLTAYAQKDLGETASHQAATELLFQQAKLKLQSQGIVLENQLSFYQAEQAGRAQKLLNLIIKIADEGSLRKDISKVILLSNNVGGISENSGTKTARINIFESNRLRDVHVRLTVESEIGIACSAPPLTNNDLREFYRSLDPKKALELTKSLFMHDTDARRVTGLSSDTVLIQRTQGCADSLCILKNVFDSEELGILLLFLLDRYGVNASFVQNSQMYVNWDLEVLRNLETTFRELPPNAIEDTKFMGRKLALRNTVKRNGALTIVANSMMEAYQDFLVLKPTEQKSYIYHEFFHTYYNNNKSLHPEWQMLFAKKQFVTDYAQLNASEDFCESVRTYRYDPTLLLKTSEEKYKYLRDKVFMGKEFLTNKQCAN